MHLEDRLPCVKEVPVAPTLLQALPQGLLNLRVIARKARPEASRTRRQACLEGGLDKESILEKLYIVYPHLSVCTHQCYPFRCALMSRVATQWFG